MMRPIFSEKQVRSINFFWTFLKKRQHFAQKDNILRKKDNILRKKRQHFAQTIMMQKCDFSEMRPLHKNRDAAVGFNIWWVLFISEKVSKGTPCIFRYQIFKNHTNQYITPYMVLLLKWVLMGFLNNSQIDKNPGF
jgi:hypothetical protein